MAEPLDLLTWLREQCADYRFNVGGVFQRDSDVSSWPLEAAGPAELEERLTQGGRERDNGSPRKTAPYGPGCVGG